MNKKSKKNKYTTLYLILIIIIGTILISLAGFYGIVAGTGVINQIILKNYNQNKKPTLQSNDYPNYQNSNYQNSLSEFDYNPENLSSGCGCGQ